MFNISEKQLAIVKFILNKHVPDVEIRAFGSRVTGKEKSYSDLDLALVGKAKISNKIMTPLKEAFQESDLPFRVDLVDWNKISKGFQEIINQNYVRI